MLALSYLSKDLEEEDDDDEYIDMELMGSSNSTANEFEFQMSSVSIEKEPTNSPADELFYKGKLLPLHLPPRLQMVKKLLHNSINNEDNKFKQGYTTAESCYISPSESCRVNRELNLEEYLFADDVNGGAGEKYTKKPWTKKLKFMKQPSIIGSKLKAYSRVYLKSLFGDHTKSAKKNTPVLEGKVDHDHDHDQDQNANRHRRSYSMAIKRHSSPSSSSSSSKTSSSSSNDGYDQNLQVLKRSNSVNAEIESPIEGAIQHCKQSIIRSRKTLSEVGFY